MSDLVKSVGTVVAAVASLAAVALAVDQFTLRSRLRRIEEWAAKALTDEKHGERRPVLDELRLDATARIVAGVMVPVWSLAEGVVWALAAPAAVVLVARSPDVGSGSIAGVVALVFIALTLTERRAVGRYLDRCRVASEYRRGLAVTPPRRRGLTEVGDVADYLFAGAFAAGACAFALGLGLTLSRHDANGLPVALVAVGACVTYFSLDALVALARKWHPLRP